MRIDFDAVKNLTLSAKAGTINLTTSGDPTGMLFEIIPHEKKDQFKISCFYKYAAHDKKGGADINDITDYKPLKDSAYRYFRFPRIPINPANEIKTKLKVTDSVIKKINNGDYGEQKYTAYIVKGKSLLIDIQKTCFKIERFQDNILLETKIITFEAEVVD